MYNKFYNDSGEDKNIFKRYKIFSSNSKYGIKKLSDDVVVDCVFDGIWWHKDENLVEFRLGSKYAICRVEDIQNL